MQDELGPDMLWALRAPAQEPHVQRELYPPFVMIADELGSDFGDAFDALSDEVRSNNEDICALDRHLTAKAGILEYWENDALERADFWAHTRRLARNALKQRGATTSAPDPSAKTYASGSEVHVNGKKLEDRS